MGILKINGMIDINDFWPIEKNQTEMSSDADTFRLYVKDDDNSFIYKQSYSEEFIPTKVFWNASCSGKKVVKGLPNPDENKNLHISIRLQGIDTPELHFCGNTKTEYRQNFAESNVYLLAKFLREMFDNNMIECSCITNVSSPNETIDSHGRFVCNVIFKDRNGVEIDINRWLVKSGLAFPMFYNSMTLIEINNIFEDWKNSNNSELSKRTISDISVFDENKIYRHGVISFKTGDDYGEVLLPKIFRRQVDFFDFQKRAKRSFSEYLNMNLTYKSDKVFLRDEFLKLGENAPKYPLSNFFKGNIFMNKPEDFVFIEKESHLRNENGAISINW
jgi:endonuclease YncB( thermonuclease family)